jgi:multidrug resistance efflux pump
MGYVGQRVARLRAQLARVRAAIAALDATYLQLATSLADSYKFDSGEGSQSTNRKKLEDVRTQIDVLEAQEAHIINELYGMGVVNMRLRRKRPNEII